MTAMDMALPPFRLLGVPVQTDRDQHGADRGCGHRIIGEWEAGQEGRQSQQKGQTGQQPDRAQGAPSVPDQKPEQNVRSGLTRKGGGAQGRPEDRRLAGQPVICRGGKQEQPSDREADGSPKDGTGVTSLTTT